MDQLQNLTNLLHKYYFVIACDYLHLNLKSQLFSFLVKHRVNLNKFIRQKLFLLHSNFYLLFRVTHGLLVPNLKTTIDHDFSSNFLNHPHSCGHGYLIVFNNFNPRHYLFVYPHRYLPHHLRTDWDVLLKLKCFAVLNLD